MKNGSQFYECLGTPKNEDFNCSNGHSFKLSNHEKYIFDHRHYFDVKVYNFKKLFFATFFLIKILNIN